jgi:cyclopropane fatty-acyl-phospholipid synthase-like methyltransferase
MERGMSQRYIEIAEAHQKFPVPLSAKNLSRLAAVCELHSGTRLLDLACGKGELLIQWAHTYEMQGTGVDEDETRISVAQMRADELEVWAQVQFVASEVADYPQSFHQYNIVSCLNATWLWDNQTAMLATMQDALKDNTSGLVLLGETYWQREPTPEICAALGLEQNALPTLADLTDHFGDAGADVVDMLLATQDDWDEYTTQEWRACFNWLNTHPAHEDAEGLRAWLNANRRRYLRYEREYIGWGIFVLVLPGPVVRDAPKDSDGMRFEWQE